MARRMQTYVAVARSKKLKELVVHLRIIPVLEGLHKLERRLEVEFELRRWFDLRHLHVDLSGERRGWCWLVDGHGGCRRLGGGAGRRSDGYEGLV
jgi:hypothetical protein